MNCRTTQEQGAGFKKTCSLINVNWCESWLESWWKWSISLVLGLAAKKTEISGKRAYQMKCIYLFTRMLFNAFEKSKVDIGVLGTMCVWRSYLIVVSHFCWIFLILVLVVGFRVQVFELLGFSKLPGLSFQAFWSCWASWGFRACTGFWALGFLKLSGLSFQAAGLPGFQAFRLSCF